MARLLHGTTVTQGDVDRARIDLAHSSVDVSLAFAAAVPVDLQPVDFLFPSLLNNNQNLLPDTPDTAAHLQQLGRVMDDAADGTPGFADSSIPAAYTYFGQFVSHDLLFEVQVDDLPMSATSSLIRLLHPSMQPLPPTVARTALSNLRGAKLDLDSVYGLSAPRDPNNPSKMLIGQVSLLGAGARPLLRPPGKGDDNDLPREPRSADLLHDRAAAVGDPRSDSNVILAQLHLVFLKAHNALVDEGRTFEEARRILRQHYQHLVLHDFLKRVADTGVVDDILLRGNRWYDALAEPFYVPIEFSAAALRFGHSMVRPSYDFNLNFNHSGDPGTTPATLAHLDTSNALSGQLGFDSGTDGLPENWIIEWERFVDTGAGRARNHAGRIRTRLAGFAERNGFRGTGLHDLRTIEGGRMNLDDAARLPVLNLLRGHYLSLPTGQAVAEYLSLPVLSREQIEAASKSDLQVQALRDGEFLDRTPLWYYILAEASHGGGNHLGPVGSTILAEVVIGLARISTNSILRQPGWVPSLPSAQPGVFELADLLRFAGVLDGGAPARTYVVQYGDTLSSIAHDQLGDSGRWPEVFVRNRAVTRSPHLLSPGLVLGMPERDPPESQPRIYVVQPGDTLAGIAERELGDSYRSSDIFALNRSVIPNPEVLIPQQVLLLTL